MILHDHTAVLVFSTTVTFLRSLILQLLLKLVEGVCPHKILVTLQLLLFSFHLLRRF